jgi:hypothetical protein
MAPVPWTLSEDRRLTQEQINEMSRRHDERKKLAETSANRPNTDPASALTEEELHVADLTGVTPEEFARKKAGLAGQSGTE